MKWAGDIYREVSGDYRIDTTYSYLGSYTVLRYRGKAIGYARDQEEAKKQAEKHAAGIVTQGSHVS